MKVANPSPNPTTQSGVIATGTHFLSGWGIRAISSAHINLRDGTSSAGNLLAPITMKAGESTRDYPTKGLRTETGSIYLEVVEGEVELMVGWE
jgi:hypothetical protein